MRIHQLAPEPDEYSYVFGGRDPQLSVDPGDIVEVSTEDCFGGMVKTSRDLPSETVAFDRLNPVSGPIEIRGAEPGDLLAVHFASIVPARDYAISATFPHFGALTGSHETVTLQPPLDERVWIYDIDVDAWTATFSATRSDHRLVMPLDPMHGTVGVAPASDEVRLVVTPSTYGGNMDTPELRAGVTLYLPVNVPGAMLSLGDGHARQGEGELCGTGLECAMNSVIAVDVVKGAAPAWPRLQNDEYLMSTGSMRPLEDAFRISQRDLVNWTAELTGMDTLDAYQLVSQTVRTPAANVCDPNFTMMAKLPTWALHDASVYGGMHQHLKAVSAKYRN
ncbi:acetamidase/formamidase family protein [Spelaeicoccus albus]|uniref:acetamidase/formamidase family protein n=1 Tax=Spelaeicoccus albus TaxID=1280376 RepID=UPI0015C8D9A6|nr:acetamidase/formamidase family protein [Spelaeicoccus albus]